MSQSLPNPMARVLVIDDNRAIHDDFKKILCPLKIQPFPWEDDLRSKPKPLEFELTSAYQGEEGLAFVQEALRAARPFAVAFVDMRMPPGWDGMETASRLWEADPDLQIIICTAYADYSWNEILTNLGRSDRLLILKKPFDVIEVRQMANAMSEKWRLLMQSRSQVGELERTVKARTQELASTQVRLEHLLHCNSAVIYSVDLNTPGSVSFISDNVMALTGHRPAEFKEDPLFWFNHVHPEDAAKVRQYVVRLSESDHETVEYRFCHKNGHYLWLRDEARVMPGGNGSPRQVLGSLVDVTDRAQAEEALRQQEDRLRSLFRALPAGVGMARNRVITEINERISEMTGYAVDELLGQSTRIFYATDQEFERVGRDLYARYGNARWAALKAFGVARTASCMTC